MKTTLTASILASLLLTTACERQDALAPEKQVPAEASTDLSAPETGWEVLVGLIRIHRICGIVITPDYRLIRNC